MGVNLGVNKGNILYINHHKNNYKNLTNPTFSVDTARDEIY